MQYDMTDLADLGERGATAPLDNSVHELYLERLDVLVFDER